MDAAHAALWYSFAVACVATVLMAWHAPGLKPIGRRRRDLAPFAALGLGAGLVVHAPYFACPLAWDTGLRAVPALGTIPHVALIVVLLTRFRWLGRMMTLRHSGGTRRLIAAALSWLGVLGYATPLLVYVLTNESSWWG